MKVKIKGLHTKQKEILKNIIKSYAKFHIINASRQSGKSFLLTKTLVYYGLTYSDDIMLVSPTYDQSERIFNNILNIKNISKFISSVKKSKPFEILFTSGSKIVFKSAERPDNIRGGSYKFVFIDEFAFIKSSVFNTIIRPTTAAKKDSKIVGVSTPKGIENEFFELAELGKDKDAKNYNYYYMHYTDNPFYDLSEVEDAKIRLPKNIFNQEYNAEFIESGGDVFDLLDNIATIENFEKYNSNEKYYAGIDFGRADDSTVLTILNQNKDVVFIKDWSKISWDLIINEVSQYLNMYKPITYAESNGIGDPLISQLKKKYRNIHDFITTNNSKKELVEQMRLDFFKQELNIPVKKLYPKLLSELSNYTYTINKTGSITYHHKTGHHDDTVDSLMIANYSHQKHNKGVGKLYHKKSTIYK